MSEAPETTPPLRLKTVPPRRGVQWVRSGFRIYFKQPLAFTGLFAAFIFVAMMLMAVPFVGPFVALMLLPWLTLVFMLATRAVLGGRSPTPALLFEPLRRAGPRRRRLVQLGLVYAAATVLVFLLVDGLDRDAREALAAAIQSGDSTPETLAPLVGDPSLIVGALLRLMLLTLLSLPFWHAPALVCWGGQSIGQALFSSTLACWRARSAFALFGLVWFATLCVFSLAVELVLGLLGNESWIVIASLPAGLLFSTVFYASLYFMFVDSFEHEAPGAEPVGA